MTTAPAARKRLSPLVYPAAALSIASLAWTTWSLVDLLGTGLIGVTVAVGADIIWGSVIIADARGLRIAGKHWTVPALGWATLLVVAAFLAWHGIAKHSMAIAAVGPFLPLGAKTIWVLALADMRDPAALTNEELHELARMERGMAFEEQQHRIEMRRRAMGAEFQMAEVATDFDIEVMRQERARELHRRRPLELAPAVPARAVSAPDTDNGQDTRTPNGHGGGQTPDTASALPGQPRTALSAAPDIMSAARADTGADNPLTRTDTADKPRTSPVRTTPDTRTDNASDTPSVAALVRHSLDNGIDDPDKVITGVRAVRPDADTDTVKRTLRRQLAQRTNYL